MPDSHQLILKKPISGLSAALNLDLKNFFINTAKFIVAATNGEASDSVEYGIKALSPTSEPAQIAWELIVRSFLKSFSKVTTEYEDLLNPKVTETELIDLEHRIEHCLKTAKISINEDFFKRPQDIGLFTTFEPILKLWLSTMGLNEYQAASFQRQIKDIFPLALHEVWSKKPEQYQCIIEALDSPFNVSVRDAISWKKYSLWLQRQANQRVFDEAFGLREIYIPLRAYYETKKKDEKKTQKHVCDLHSSIFEWLNQLNKQDTLKVICGGPGSGKSSFAKVIAAEIIEKKIAPVLFIPLHHFNLSNSLTEAIGDFITDTCLKNNPLHPDYIQDRLVLIFDGLDELSEQGQAAKAAAGRFIDSLTRELDRKNDNNKQWQAIITGRDLSIQDNQHNLKNETQIFHLLPYRIESDELHGNQNLLEIDQCSLWWQKLGKVKGQSYSTIPSELDQKNLSPITREPLLNYLVSLSYERKSIDFNDSTSLNKIYYDLISAVYERAYADRRHHEASKYLRFEEFLEVLEEMAIAIWHGNGRTTSESYLLKRFEETGLTPYLERFAESCKKGVIKLLTAFYFREFDSNTINDRTFELTHKSFGEYLTARYIVRSALNITEEVMRHQNDHKKGWSKIEALEKWIQVTGPSLVDEYLNDLIKNEIKTLNKVNQENMQKVFAELLNIVVTNDSPMEKFRKLSFSQMLEQSKNSETALLSIHCACATNTKTRSKLNSDSFNNWVKRIGTNNVFRASFHYLEFFKANCFLENFEGFEFCYSYFDDCDFTFAHMSGVNFEGATIKSVSFDESYLVFANFKSVTISGTSFFEANLTNANLNFAHSKDIYLEATNLKGTILEDIHR